MEGKVIPRRTLDGAKRSYDVFSPGLRGERCIGSVTGYGDIWVARMPGVKTREEAMELLRLARKALEERGTAGNGQNQD